MDIEQYWNKALKHTEIIRSRIHPLYTLNDTQVPYILLSESEIDPNDTVVRKGIVVVKKPSLYLPPNNPQLSGFDFDSEEDVDPNTLINFLIVRGISIPSMQYDNQTQSLDIFEQKLSKAVAHFEKQLAQEENTHAGLLIGPQDCWQFSLLIFVCAQIAKNAQSDIQKLLEDYHNRDQEK